MTEEPPSPQPSVQNHIPPLGARRPGSGARWSQERRLEFIEFRLLWEGRINRAELVDFFGISIQQASLDLARYMELAPGNLAYDRSEKVYKAKRDLNLVFTRADSQTFLDQLSRLTAGTLTNPLSFIGSIPPYDVVLYPTRSIQPRILMRVIWAIRDGEDINISYQSMRRPVATQRWISPHAIAFDGSRWHVRAWCYENKDFRDFVFARIQQVHDTRKATIDPRLDVGWHSFVTVMLRARSGLTAGQRLAVEAEFGMQDGVLRISMREALVYYFVRHLRLDGGTDSAIGTQLIEWINEDDLAHLVRDVSTKR